VGQRKKYRKIALFSHFLGRPTEKRPKNSKKRPKNSTFKPLYTIFVPCLKIHGGHGPLPPAADAHGYNTIGSSSCGFIVKVKGERAIGRPRTRWNDYIEDFGGNRFGLRPSEVMENGSGSCSVAA